MRYSVGIDVGGTFTDGVALDDDGKIHTAKVPSVPREPNLGFARCLERLSGSTGLGLTDFVRETDLIVHGTTITVNALLTGKGAKVGLIATEGFRDILEMRRSQRDSTFDMSIGPPPTLVPRHLRYGVRERVDFNGKVVVELDRSELAKVLQELKNEGVESAAVCLLHSYMNPKHEELIGEELAKTLPGSYVSLSSHILPVIKEYERTSTTVMNSYVGPVFEAYTRGLLRDLAALGFKGKLLLMHSGGGVMTAENMVKRAAYSVFSGPSAAPSVALFFSGLVGSRNLLTVDMGGTSFDVARVFDGVITTTNESVVNRYPIMVPAVEVVSIGAGGGSVAWIDSGRMLHVGPTSAGADPGPACYDKGGTEPTVTDANVVLGYLNPKFFLGGEVILDEQASRRVIKERIASPLNLSVAGAAAGIYRLVNENMAGAIRTMMAKRGDYPSDFVMVVGGGAGAAHSCYLAESTGILRIFIPKLASFLCAFGMMSSNLKYDLARSRPTRVAKVEPKDSLRVFKELKSEGRARLKESGVRDEEMDFAFSVDMRYAKQVHEVEVPVGLDARLDKIDLAQMVSDFHRRHEQLYTYRDQAAETELVTYRVVATGKRPPIRLTPLKRTGSGSDGAIKAVRKVFFEPDFVDASVYDGGKLTFGHTVEGPAVIEDVTTTVVLPPDHRLTVDKYGNYHVVARTRNSRRGRSARRELVTS